MPTLRDLLRQYLIRRHSEVNAAIWALAPLIEVEQSLGQVADWGPDEDWREWEQSLALGSEQSKDPPERV
jgi:hypothetical protein